MGTRADFYTGRGRNAVWIGSIAWDGYPEGIENEILKATTEKEFREGIAEHMSARDDFTSPEMGWPWPWDDSRITDYSYAFDNGKVWASCFGHKWFDPLVPQSDDEDERSPKEEFPDMKAISNPNFGDRSGVLIFSSKEESK